MTTATGEVTPPSDYPVRFEIRRPDSQSRLTNFPLGIGSLIRYVLAIPHLIILYFLALVAYLIFFIATFAILFTGRYPRGMYDFVAGFLRWSACLSGYLYHLYDKYPPFSMEDKADYPVVLQVSYPESSSRLLNFPILGMLIKGLLLIPHYVVILFLTLIALLVLFIAMFAILFTGSFPGGMHGFVAGVLRWNTRLSAYTFALTDKYPPFSLN